MRTLSGRGNRLVFASSAIMDALRRVHRPRPRRPRLRGRVGDERRRGSIEARSRLVATALDKLGTRDAVMVGDTPWDCEAARKAGIPTIALLRGGYSGEELTGAGAQAVFRSPRELSESLPDTALA